jgi:hypothetical protein
MVNKNFGTKIGEIKNQVGININSFGNVKIQSYQLKRTIVEPIILLILLQQGL